MARSEIRNPTTAIINQAVHQARTPGAQIAGSGAGRSGSAPGPPDVTTTQHADGEDVHPFILGLDVLGDVHAVMTDTGN